MPEEHSDILEQFEPITLKEMESVKLMNRTDTKFVLTLAQFKNMVKELKGQYRILEIDGKKLCRYNTLYYDTINFDLYKQHHNGKLNRYKIRHRTYVESNLGFLEVKFKNNKGRTIKTRISRHDIPYQLENDCRVFLDKILPFKSDVLVPVIWINYSRYTFVNKKGAERLTIDLNLEFLKDEKKEDLSNVAIAEVKQDKKKTSPFIEIMKRNHIRRGSISKYCLGIAMTNAEVKKNNFKAKLTSIKRKNIC